MCVRSPWRHLRFGGAVVALLCTCGCLRANPPSNTGAASAPPPAAPAPEEDGPTSSPPRPSPGPIVRISVHTLFFPSGSATLDLNARAVLDGIAEEMRVDSTRALRVEGHTDEKTEKGHSQDLAAQRVQAVVTYLGQQHGVPAGRFETAIIGSARPFAPSEVPEGPAHNRRVEFWWGGKPGPL